MNLWFLASSLIFSLGLNTSLNVYQLPLISIFNDNNQASFQSVELDEEEVIPHKIDNKSLGVKISASSAAVLDKESGLVLWQKNATEKRSIASITKLMTALVFLDNNPGWNTEITMEQSDERKGGTVRILRDEVVTVENLFYTSLIASDNNATIALVRSTGLSEEEFVAAMNRKAVNLGLENTSFSDPTGLRDDNISTALDVLTLAQTAFANKDINKATGTKTYNFQAISGKQHKLLSTNLLFNSFLEIEAGKTGFVNSSGYCLVAEIGQDNNHNIISVVLGSDTHEGRFQELKILSAWILENFSWS